MKLPPATRGKKCTAYSSVTVSSLQAFAGNSLECTADWYRPDEYARRVMLGKPVHNPRGPATSFDPAEPGIAKRVQKGGSFLCTDEYCARYRPGARGKAAPDSSANHMGFRLVRDSTGQVLTNDI